MANRRAVSVSAVRIVTPSAVGLQCYVTNSNVNKHRGIATAARLGMLTITVSTELF